MTYRKLTKWLGPLLAILISGCSISHKNPNDPFESYNRKLFTFNVIIDHLFLRPVATLYNTVTPDIAQKHIHNAFENLDGPVTMGNDLLQGKMQFFVSDTFRFLVNSTIGVLGLFDVAKHMNMPDHTEDFGMTLSYWTHDTKPTYFMIPFLGPSSINHLLGIPVNLLMRPTTYLLSRRQLIYLTVSKIIDKRAYFLDADSMVDNAFDPYAFLRDFYIQYRTRLLKNNYMTFGQFLAASKSANPGMVPPTPDNTEIDYGPSDEFSLNATTTPKKSSTKNKVSFPENFSLDDPTSK